MKRSGFAVTLVGISSMSLPFLHRQEPVAWRAVTLDFYDRGIHLAGFSILATSDPSGSFTVRQKDVRRSAWNEPGTVLRTGQMDQPELQAGNLGNFAPLTTVSEIDWSALQAVAWPDVDSIYLRHRAGSSSRCCRDDLISEVLFVPAQGDGSPVTMDGAECGSEGAGADGVTGLWKAQDGVFTPGSGSRLRR